MTAYKDTILRGIKENMSDKEIILLLMAGYGVTAKELPEGFEDAVIKDIKFLKENPDAE